MESFVVDNVTDKIVPEESWIVGLYSLSTKFIVYNPHGDVSSQADHEVDSISAEWWVVIDNLFSNFDVTFSIVSYVLAADDFVR